MYKSLFSTKELIIFVGKYKKRIHYEHENHHHQDL